MSLDKSVLEPPEPVRFDEPMAQPEQIGFMSSQVCRTGFGAFRLQCLDDGLTLVLKTKGIPVWFVIGCFLIPASGFVAYFVKTLVWDGKVDVFMVWGCIAFPIIIADILGFVRIMNRRAGDGKLRLIFDRAAGMVELPELGLTIPSKAIRRWILVQGFQSKKDKRETNSTWVAELSLVAEGDWDGLRRIHVISVSGPRIPRIAERLAAETHVPLTSCRSSLEISD